MPKVSSSAKLSSSVGLCHISKISSVVHGRRGFVATKGHRRDQRALWSATGPSLISFRPRRLPTRTLVAVGAVCSRTGLPSVHWRASFHSGSVPSIPSRRLQSTPAHQWPDRSRRDWSTGRRKTPDAKLNPLIPHRGQESSCTPPNFAIGHSPKQAQLL